MMIMFLRLLKFSYGSHQLSREISLWWDQRQSRRSGRDLYGLGFSVTLPQSGYCWFLPKIDWTRFTFQRDLQGQSLFGNTHMTEAYQVRWRAVCESKDDFAKVEAFADWLRQYQNTEAVCTQLINELICLCMCHFRKDVLASIKKLIRPEYQQDAVEGKITLCKANLDRILLPVAGEEEEEISPYRLASGNGLVHKNLSCFTDFLWDFDDEQLRKHWANKSYRMLYRRASEAVAAALGANAADEFAEKLKRYFWNTNWVVPYPNRKMFWQRNRQGQLMWLSIWHPVVHEEVKSGQTLDYSSIAKYSCGGHWLISLKNNPVMQGIPEESPTLSLDEMKQQIQDILQQPEENDRRRNTRSICQSVHARYRLRSRG
jgi:hypothetical protein